MKLFYRSFGEGKPLIIIHGLFGMSDNWITLGKKLAEKYKVIIPDIRNHGNSPHNDEFNLKVLTDDINELFLQLNIDSAYLIGHSLGGRIAVSVSLQYPEKIEKLIVVDIAPRAYSGNKNISNLLEVMNRLDLTCFNSLSSLEQHISRFIPDFRIRNLLLKNLKKNKDGFFEWKLNLSIISKNVETLMRPVFEDSHFDKPVLFLKGNLSDFITSEDHHIIHKYFPNSVIKSIPNAGHWLHADQPDLFMSEIYRFLAD